MTKWLRWFFRRGARGSLLLNMAPGDEVVSMIQYRQYLCIATRGGEFYMLTLDEFDTPGVDEVHQAIVHRVTP